MPQRLDNNIDKSSDRPDKSLTLWEAMGELHTIQTQEKIALDKGDIDLFRQLLKQQARAWNVVYLQASRLINRGEAPPDMIRRLEKILDIHHDHEQRIRQANAAIRRKLAQMRDDYQAA